MSTPLNRRLPLRYGLERRYNPPMGRHPLAWEQCMSASVEYRVKRSWPLAAVLVCMTAATVAVQSSAAQSVDSAATDMRMVVSDAKLRSRCEALRTLTIPLTAIALPTGGAGIVSTSVSEPSDPNGLFCKIAGAIQPVDKTAPPIRFAINLPARWNHKAIHLGGGGYNGLLVDGLHANFLGVDGGRLVGRGFVTFGSDSGHQTNGPPTSAEFALNAEAAANFGGAQLKKVHDVAIRIIMEFYKSAPRRLYFYGNSQGGHEGLTVAQRWPQDYAGVVAVHPAYDFTALQLSGIHLGQALYRTPASWLSPEAVKLIATAVLNTCDELDGVKDGIISNIAQCRIQFHLETLRCPDAQPAGPQCLSDAQIQTVQTFDEPTVFGFAVSGLTEFPRWPLLEGAFTAPVTEGFFGLGSTPTPGVPPGRKDAFVYIMGDQLVRFMVMKDPAYDSLQFKPAQHAAELAALSKQMDASDPNLDAFKAHGGKLLLMHGTVDMAISPHNTVAYYTRLEQRYPGQELSQFVRFYMVPGFGHGDGAFQVSWDSVSALDAWVEKGEVPSGQIATDTATATAGRSRPLCDYPSWPRYVGQDPNSAASFKCVTP